MALTGIGKMVKDLPSSSKLFGMTDTSEAQAGGASGFADQTNDIANGGGKSHSHMISFEHVASGRSTRFKAILTAFEDQYTSTWNSEDVYGRMDPIMTFQRTGRVINFQLDVVAGSYMEAFQNQARISALIQMLYPEYKGHTMTSSPFMRISYNNLIQDTPSQSGLAATGFRGGPNNVGSTFGKGLLGVLSGISYQPDMDFGVFADEWGNVYPKILRVACSFTVIHENRLGWGPTGPRSNTFPYGDPQKYHGISNLRAGIAAGEENVLIAENAEKSARFRDLERLHRQSQNSKAKTKTTAAKKVTTESADRTRQKALENMGYDPNSFTARSQRKAKKMSEASKALLGEPHGTVIRSKGVYRGKADIEKNRPSLVEPRRPPPAFNKDIAMEMS